MNSRFDACTLYQDFRDLMKIIEGISIIHERQSNHILDEGEVRDILSSILGPIRAEVPSCSSNLKFGATILPAVLALQA